MYQTSLLCASVKAKCPVTFCLFFFFFKEHGIFLIVETKRKAKYLLKQFALVHSMLGDAFWVLCIYVNPE